MTSVLEPNRFSNHYDWAERAIEHSCKIGKGSTEWKIEIDQILDEPSEYLKTLMNKQTTGCNKVEPCNCGGLYCERYLIEFPSITMHTLISAKLDKAAIEYEEIHPKSSKRASKNNTVSCNSEIFSCNGCFSRSQLWDLASIIPYAVFCIGLFNSVLCVLFLNLDLHLRIPLAFLIIILFFCISVCTQKLIQTCIQNTTIDSRSWGDKSQVSKQKFKKIANNILHSKRFDLTLNCRCQETLIQPDLESSQQDNSISNPEFDDHENEEFQESSHVPLQKQNIYQDEHQEGSPTDLREAPHESEEDKEAQIIEHPQQAYPSKKYRINVISNKEDKLAGKRKSILKKNNFFIKCFKTGYPPNNSVLKFQQWDDQNREHFWWQNRLHKLQKMIEKTTIEDTHKSWTNARLHDSAFSYESMGAKNVKEDASNIMNKNPNIITSKSATSSRLYSKKD
ncbi:unnamed protein product [Moneuplotes crassus]|uniref:Uncharacterized protein n=1 Tax=Euplotes crassus TaxID=5936 RepID=A0AAD1Y4H5_EUPCR|nr:unnamed protein product [Moneuplotes crassus]